MVMIKEKLKSISIVYKSVRFLKNLYHFSYDVYFKGIVFIINKFLIKIKLVKTEPKLLILKNKHTSKRIFIVATGPSLKIEDLNTLQSHNEITISYNSIFKIFDKTNWKPSYYIMDDWFLYQKFLCDNSNIDFSKFASSATLFSIFFKKLIKKEELSKFIFFNMYYFDHWYTNFSNKFIYDKDFSSGIFDFYTVTNTAITLADYMGASEIYLLGVDCNFGSTNILHAGENEDPTIKTKKLQLLELEKTQKRAYAELSKRLKTNVNIYNASRGGTLEVFERKNFDDLF